MRYSASHRRVLRRRRGGDNDLQVRNRRVFLDAGYFEALLRELTAAVPAGSVVDVGCGEGYYSRPLATQGRPWVGAIDRSNAPPGGVVIAVGPGPLHLIELKQR